MTKVTPIFSERDGLEPVMILRAGSNFLLSAIIQNSPQPPPNSLNITKFMIDTRIPEYAAEILGEKENLLGMIFLAQAGLIKFKAPLIEWRYE